MHALYYNRLYEQTLNQKPYRGTYNRFPVDKRTQSNKYFLVEEENNEEVYRVFYGERQVYTNISKEAADFYRGKVNARVAQRGSPTSPTFYLLETEPNDVFIVRPDNTFEFTAKNLTQGGNSILSSWSYGRYYHSVRHGGAVYSGRSNYEDRGAFHPLWKGARFDMVKMIPYTPYQVFGLAVKRKAAKDYFKSYEKFFTVARTMSLAMGWENFERTAIDVINEHIADFDWSTNGWVQPERTAKFLPIAKSLQDTAPLDAYVLYLCAYNSNVMTRLITKVKKSNHYSRTSTMNELYSGFHRSITQDIYRTTPELFKEVEYEAGKQYPANNWGIKVLVDGQQVKQY